MLLFVLGRQPEIGVAELRAIFGSSIKSFGQLAILDQEPDYDFNRLGSVTKVARVISSSWLNIERHLPTEGKVTLGFSTYETNLSVRDLSRIGSDIKRKRGSVRLIPSDDQALSSATVFHNKLAIGNDKKVEFILTRHDNSDLLAKTIFVQDINAYTFRDRSRPKRDARVGMLPPKLAQTMINLASGSYRGKETAQRLLDPFCGTGVVLQEAALMGLSVYGTDLEPRMIDYSEANLEWLSKTHRISFESDLEIGDATSLSWRGQINLVATETYLGRPFTEEPTIDALRDNIKNCEIILSKFLRNLHSQVSSDTGMTIAVPYWFVGGKPYRLQFTKDLGSLGFEQVFYSDDKQSLKYRREDQIVGRELLILRKKD